MTKDLDQIEKLALQVADLRVAVLLTCTFAMKAATLAASEDREKSKAIIDEMESILDEIHTMLNFDRESENG